MSFKAINLSEQMIKSLARQGFNEPSEIQLRSIPKALRVFDRYLMISK